MKITERKARRLAREAAALEAADQRTIQGMARAIPVKSRLKDLGKSQRRGIRRLQYKSDWIATNP